jgi:hypothetical protein
LGIVNTLFRARNSHKYYKVLFLFLTKYHLIIRRIGLTQMIIRAPKPGESLDAEPPLVEEEQGGDHDVLAGVRQCLDDYRLLLADYGDGNPYAKHGFLPSCGYQIKDSLMIRRYAWFREFCRDMLLSRSSVSSLQNNMRAEIVACLRRAVELPNVLGVQALRERAKEMLTGTFINGELDEVLDAAFNVRVIRTDRVAATESAGIVV